MGVILDVIKTKVHQKFNEREIVIFRRKNNNISENFEEHFYTFRGIRGEAGNHANPSAAQISPDSQLIAYQLQNAIKLLNLNEGGKKSEDDSIKLMGHKARVICLKFSPDNLL